MSHRHPPYTLGRVPASARSARYGRALLAVVIVALIAAFVAFGHMSTWRKGDADRTLDIAAIAQTPPGQRVSIEGDITYYDAGRRLAVAQDDTSAIAVAVPPGISFRAHQRVRISGVLPPGHDPNAPTPLALDDVQFTTVRNQIPPPARRASMTEFVAGSEPVRFEIAGIVKAVREQNGRVHLEVTGEGASVTALVKYASFARLSGLVDARVSLRGVRFVAATPAPSWMILLTDASDITVIDVPPANPAQVASLRALFEPRLIESGHRIRVRGRTLANAQGSSLVLTDGTVGVPVHTEETFASLPAGTAVEVEGWPVKIQHAILLQSARIVATDVPLPENAVDTRLLTNADQIWRMGREEASRARQRRGHRRDACVGRRARSGRNRRRRRTGTRSALAPYARPARHSAWRDE
jgi:hypothetical protein